MSKTDFLHLDRWTEVLSALAAPERLKIVRFLVARARNVTEIVEMLGIRSVNVSHHLTMLKKARLIEGTKRGRFVWYALRPEVLAGATEAGGPLRTLNLGCCRIELPLTTSRRSRQ